MAPPQSACCPVGRMGSTRARSNSIPALPYMARLSLQPIDLTFGLAIAPGFGGLAHFPCLP